MHCILHKQTQSIVILNLHAHRTWSLNLQTVPPVLLYSNNIHNSCLINILCYVNQRSTLFPTEKFAGLSTKIIQSKSFSSDIFHPLFPEPRAALEPARPRRPTLPGGEQPRELCPSYSALYSSRRRQPLPLLPATPLFLDAKPIHQLLYTHSLTH